MNRITLLLLFAVFFTTASLRAADFTVDDIAYTITSATAPYTVAVSSKSPIYTGAVTIPASVSYNSISYSVTSIGESAFSNCSGLTSVNFPATSSLTSIGNSAFYQCSSLTSVTIPSLVTSIGTNAFVYCTGLTSVNFSVPSSLTSIAQQAFFQCQGLTSITFPSSVTSIGPSVFYGCSQLTSVNFSAPSSLTTLGDYAFYYCTGLTSVNLSATSLLTSIGAEAFSGCASLTSINIPSSVTSIERYSFYNCTGLTSVSISATSSLTSIGDGVFYGCQALTSVNIPSSVTSIGSGSFQYCKGLTSVTIPPSVTSIATSAFANCTGLTSFYAQLETPINLSSSPSVFSGVNTSTCILHVPYGSSALYAAADQWKDFTNRVEMAEFKVSATKARIESASGSSASIGLTTALSWTSLSNQSWLTVSPLSGSNNATLVLTAGENTSYSPRFAKVTVSAAGVPTQTISITQLGVLVTVNNRAGDLFAKLDGRQSQITRLTVTGTIDARDFKTMRDDMPLLAEIDISGATIAAFTGTGGTTAGSATYPVNTVPQYAFYNSSTGVSKTSLTSIILPSTATSIDTHAFYHCTGLSAITIPSLVTTIGYQAFYQCTKLTSVTIPSSVTSIEHYAFQECTGLTSVNFSAPSSLTSMGTGVFIYCSGLTSVTIPSSLTSIPIHAFYQCTGLTSVNIPSSVTSIEEAAFLGCTGLTSVNIPSSVTSIGQSAFYFCTGLTSVNIPSAIKSLGAQAFAYCSGLTSVTFSTPSSLTSIGAAAFYYCTNLASVILPESVTSIGSSAFSLCTELSTVSIPSKVTFIGEYSFYSSNVLASIYAYPVTPVDLIHSVSVFLNVNKNTCRLFVPYGTKVLYAAADQWKDFLKILEIPTAGSIAASQTICYNTAPATLTSSSPGLVMTGATLSYRWEYSTDGIVWTSTGATNATFAPEALTQMTMFHRITVSTLDGFSWESVPTEPVTITVMTEVTAGTIGTNQTICNGTTPSPLTSTTVGTGSGAISYEWQTNASGIYVTIAGATSAGYSPLSLAATTSYQRRTVSSQNGINCYSGYTTPVTVTVNPLPAAVAGSDRAICLNTSTQIGAAVVTGSTYSWTSSPAGFTSTTANPTVSPKVTTTYTVVETITATGCTNTHSVTVTVNPLPAAVAGSDRAICLNTSTQIGAAVVTGSTYSWTSSPAGFTSTTANPTVSPTVTTTYTVVETITATGCSNTHNVTVTVNPLPAAVAGSDRAICMNTSTQIGAAVVTGSTYSWTSSPAGFTSTTANPTVSPKVTTTYTVVETITATGCSKTNSMTITVNPLPSAQAGADRTICMNTSTQIGAAAVTGNTYSWSSSPAGFASTVANPTVTPLGTTIYTLVETITATGCSKTNSMTVTVLASPNTSVIAGKQTPACNETGVTYSVTATLGSSYAWTVPSGAIITSGATGPNNNQITVSFGSTNGDIAVVETNTNSCSGTTKKLSINLVGCGMNADFTGSPLTVCQGSAVTFTNTSTGTTGSTIYSWDFGAGATPAKATTSGPHVVSYSTSGQKTVSLTITDGASKTETKTNYITVNSNVTITAFSPVSSTRCQGAGTVTTTTTATNNSAAIVYSLDEASLAGGNTINSTTGAVTYSADWSSATTITASADGCNGPAKTTHVVTITPTVSPVVNIDVASGSIPTCSGSSVTFTATPINGGTSPTYHWKKGSTNVGTNSATYTDDATAAGSISVVMTTSLDCVTSTTATSNTIDLTITSPGQWLGKTSNWDDPSNWCGGVPTSSTNISISKAKEVTQPIIGVLTSASCKNITIADGATLTIASDAIGTGSLIISGTVSGAGSAFVKRYMTTDAWHIVASPVSGQSIAGFLTANPNVAEDMDDASIRGMMDYNPAINAWKSYFTNSTPGDLETGKGFSIRTDASSAVTFTGKLNAATVSVGGLSSDRWNCIGNPYTSAIGINNSSSSAANFLNVNAIVSTNLHPSYGAIYIWDNGDGNNGELGKYTIISNTPVDAPYHVQQGQAYMVLMNDAKTSVSFTSAMQTHLPGLALKSAESAWPIIKLEATVNNLMSSTILAFNDRMTKGLDVSYDAGLLRGGSDLVLYSKLVQDNGIPFAIQALPANDFSKMIIPLGIESKTGGEVVFSSESISLPLDCQVILEDKLNKSFTNLLQKDYMTSISANSVIPDRFQIHTSYLTTGLNAANLAGQLTAYAIRNVEIRVKGQVSKQAVATLYDIQGRVILVKNLEEGSINAIQTPNIKTAIYLLIVNDNGKSQSFKIPVKE